MSLQSHQAVRVMSFGALIGLHVAKAHGEFVHCSREMPA